MVQQVNEPWQFFDLQDKPALSASEVCYWKQNLDRILKVGLEFEFNLPEGKGFCTGASEVCPCDDFKPENLCWQKCINEPSCKEFFGDDFEAKCTGVSCSAFKMFCSECKNIKINCAKCAYLKDPDHDPSNVRTQLREQLSPSESYGHINSGGVHSITTDGSLLGDKGAEIITNGRRVDYWEFHSMIDKICKESIKRGAYVNERCSVHQHLLTSYYNGDSSSNELERPMPQIIMANFHQLLRKYQNAITWMTTALDDRNTLTRWEKFRVSVLKTSPVKQSMTRMVRELAEKVHRGGKYSWINYTYSRFDDNSDVSRFHIELRTMDGIMSASVVSAMSCLFYAVLLKAVEISKYGLLKVGDKKWLEKTLRIKNRLMNNNMEGWTDTDRFSHTEDLSDEDMETLCCESMDLIAQVKHILFKLGPAYSVLEKLAVKPVSILRCEHKTWEEIEEYYSVYRPVESLIEQKLMRCIDLRQIKQCPNEVTWVKEATRLLNAEVGINMEQISQIINDYKLNGKCIWSNSIGAIILV